MIFLRKKVQNLWFRRGIYTILLMIVMGLVIPLVIYSYHNEGSKRDTLFLKSVPVEDYIEVQAVVMATDFPARRMVVHFTMNPYGAYAGKGNILAKPLTAFLAIQNVQFPANATMQDVEYNVPFLTGNVRDYPFDAYRADSLIMFQETNTTNPVPVSFLFDGVIAGVNFKSDFIEVDGGTPNMYDFVAEVHRNSTTLFFSIFVVVTMWLISIAIFIMAVQVLFSGREIPPPLVGFGATILFAFPALRNSFPGVPQIGCYIDTVGFFGPISIVSISTCAIVFTFLLRWRAPTPRIIARLAPQGHYNVDDLYYSDKTPAVIGNVESIHYPSEHTYQPNAVAYQGNPNRGSIVPEFNIHRS